MANRTLYPLRGVGGPGKVLVTFGIAPNGTDPPTIVEDYGNYVASVTRSGVGVYAIVLNDTWLALASIQTQLQLSAAADSMVQITGAPTVATTKTITTTILTAGAAADIAANAANVIFFTLVLRETDAQ
jgi:hypothetical protein